MTGREFSHRTMTAISLTIIIVLIALGTLVNVGLHKLRLDSAATVEDKAIYSLSFRALRNTHGERLIQNANLDAGRFSESCARVDLDIGKKHQEFELVEWLNCDFDDALPFNLQILRLTTAGYNPDVELLIGIEDSNRLSFLRVLEHHETSSFGAELVAHGSSWLNELTGLTRASLVRPMTDSELDAVSGATITANSIRRAVGNTFFILDNASLPSQ